MKNHVKKALELQISPDEFKSFRVYMAEYHSNIEEILLDAPSEDDDEFTEIFEEIVEALLPGDRMVYVIMEFLTGIMGGGLAGVFYNSDEKNVSRIREAIVLTGSDFLMNKFEEGLLLFKTIEDENSEDEDEEYSETAEQVDQIGEDIDNWDWDELKTTYIALGK